MSATMAPVRTVVEFPFPPRTRGLRLKQSRWTRACTFPWGGANCKFISANFSVLWTTMPGTLTQKCERFPGESPFFCACLTLMPPKHRRPTHPTCHGRMPRSLPCVRPTVRSRKLQRIANDWERSRPRALLTRCKWRESLPCS